jgi:hypothetical protein
MGTKWFIRADEVAVPSRGYGGDTPSQVFGSDLVPEPPWLTNRQLANVATTFG